MSAPDPEFCGWHRSVHLSLTLKMNRPDEMPLSGTQTWGHVEHKHHTSVDGAASSGDLGYLMKHQEGTGLGGGRPAPALRACVTGNRHLSFYLRSAPVRQRR